MSLDRLNAIPTADTPLGARKRNPLLNPPGSKLFRPGYEAFEAEGLPFVEAPTPDGEARNWWLPDRPENLTLQAEMGRHFGAAYFLYVVRNGPQALPLTWIINDMKDEHDLVAQTFLSYLDRVLFTFGHYLSAQDIEAHLEAVIADDRLFYESGELEEAGLANPEVAFS